MSQSQSSALQRFRNSDRRPTRIRRGDFTLTNGESGRRSVVAEYTAPYPIEIRQDIPFRLMMGYHQAEFHDGNTTAEQTYALDQSAIETENTTPFVVYADSTQLAEGDSTPDDDEFYVDYSANEVTVEVDTDVTLHMFYYSDDGLLVEIVKESPGGSRSLVDPLFDDITSDLFQRNQHRDSPYFQFNQSQYQGVIPKDWTLAIYQDGSNYGIDWDDSDTDTTGSMTVNDIDFTTPIIDIPAHMAKGNIEGLGREVKRDIGSRN